MSSRVVNNTTWYNSPIEISLLKAISVLVTFLGFGYGLGAYVTYNGSKFDKIELQRQADTRLQEEINKCREEKLEVYGKSLDELKTVVKELEKKEVTMVNRSMVLILPKLRVFISMLFLLLLFAGLTFTFFFFHEENDNLRLEVTDLKIKSRNDSLYFSRINDYSKVIDKYVDTGGLRINGVSVSTSQLVKIVNEYIKESKELNQKNLALQDSIISLLILMQQQEVLVRTYKEKYYTYFDSFRVANHINDLVKRYYGIEFSVERKDKELFFKNNFSETDTAIKFYRYFGKYLVITDSFWRLDLNKK